MKTLFLAASILFFTGYSSQLISQTSTEGEMTFTVRTVTFNGNFSPKHVLAIWVEDSNGFVLSRKLRAVKRKQYLYTWNTQSGGNVVDAVTGETLLSHQTHTVSWDCKDVNGNLVPDGEYTVYVEFTEAHEQGPLKGIVFTKGSEPVSLAPVDDANFKDLALSFEPVIAVTAAYTFIAEDLTVTFTNTSTGATNYAWDFGDENSSTEENPVHTYADAGTYTVILTAEAGSSSATYQESVTVSAPAVVSAAYTFVAEELTVSFTNTSTGATSYAWDFGDENSSTEENPVHSYADAGTYTVILTAESGSSSATYQESVVVSSTVGIGDSYATVSQVYPNPTSGIIMINLEGQAGSCTFKIYSLDGSLLYSEQKYNPGMHMVNISGYKSGTYLLQVDNDSHSSSQLIIKE
jgi:PKD repeat protein